MPKTQRLGRHQTRCCTTWLLGPTLASNKRDSSKQRRGLSFIYRSSMQVRPCSNIIIDSPSTFEFQLVELRSGQTKCVLCNIYRPPSSDKRKFYDELIPFLEVVVAKAGDRLVLSGDFTCPGDSSAPDPELTSILDSFDLTQHMNKPTRKHNLLDILITPSTSDVLSNVRVHQPNSISDHQLVTCQLGIEPKKLEERTFSFRDIQKIDIEAF